MYVTNKVGSSLALTFATWKGFVQDKAIFAHIQTVTMLYGDHEPLASLHFRRRQRLKKYGLIILAGFFPTVTYVPTRA